MRLSLSIGLTAIRRTLMSRLVRFIPLGSTRLITSDGRIFISAKE